MSYIIEQKIKNHIYLYEVTSYWDKEKKQPRQKRHYLGRKDKGGHKVAKSEDTKSLPRVIRDYGHLCLLNFVAAACGLKEKLEQVFHENAGKLLGLAYFLISEAKQLYLQKAWSNGNYIHPQAGLSSQQISELLREIGADDRNIRDFFREWIRRQGDIKGIYFDITSLSSYSQLIDLLEWGYNRDGEKLPQINLGLMMGQPSGYPLFYSFYPGSIPDVSTLANIVKLSADYNVPTVCLIMDRGFYSASNIREMAEAGMKFVMPMPFNVKKCQQILAKTNLKLHSAENAFSFRGRAVFHTVRDIDLDGIKLKAHCYLNEARRSEELGTFLKRLEDLESAVQKKTFYSRNEIIEFLDGQMRWSNKLYKIELNAGKALLKRKQKALARWMNRMGKMVVLTNDENLSRDEILAMYKQKDEVEKSFDNMKNEVNSTRLRIQSREAMEGRLFLNFITMILYSAITARMRKADLFKKYSVMEVLGELKTLRAVEIMGIDQLSEISKKQKQIFEALEIPIPTSPSY